MKFVFGKSSIVIKCVFSLCKHQVHQKYYVFFFTCYGLCEVFSLWSGVCQPSWSQGLVSRFGSRLCFCSVEATVELRQRVHREACWSCGQGLIVVLRVCLKEFSTSSIVYGRVSSASNDTLRLLVRLIIYTVVAPSISRMVLEFLVPLRRMSHRFKGEEYL